MRNSPLRQRTASSRTCPAKLDPGRAGADDDDREPLLPLGGVVLDGRHLEGAEDPPAQLEGVVDRLHSGRVAGELVVAEVRLVHPGGDDQAVVGDLEVPEMGGRGGVHDPLLEIEPRHLGQLDADVLVAPDDVTQRRGDLPRREHAGGDLVQQRLEQVVVASIDQRDVDGRMGEMPDRQQPTEAPADDRRPGAAPTRPAIGYRPGLECMMPPSAKIVVAVR